VKLNPGSITLDKTHYYVSGDTGNDGILGVGETWTFSINTGTLTGNTTYTAVATAPTRWAMTTPIRLMPASGISWWLPLSIPTPP